MLFTKVPFLFQVALRNMNVFPCLVIFSISFLSKTFCIRLCGRQLADMLDLVCDGRGFNVMYHSRELHLFFLLLFLFIYLSWH